MRRPLASALLLLLLTTVAGCGSSRARTVTVSRTVTAPASTTPASASSTTAPTTTATSAQPAPAPSGPALHLAFFRSPSSNIGCEMAKGIARCDIADRTWKAPPRPKSCPLDYGQGLIVTGNARGTFTCAGDTALNAQNPPLPYGRSSSVGGMTCASATAGITCRSASGHGFTIARSSYRLF